MREEESGYSPSSLQASWNVQNTWNIIIHVFLGEGNTKNTRFYHLIDQERWGKRRGGMEGNRLTRASHNLPQVNKSYNSANK